jgi:hypothetical protein
MPLSLVLAHRVEPCWRQPALGRLVGQRSIGIWGQYDTQSLQLLWSAQAVLLPPISTLC